MLMFAVSMVFTVPGEHGNKGVHPQLSGLLYQQIHFFPLQQSLHKDQWRFCLAVIPADPGYCGAHQVFVGLFKNGGKHGTAAIEKFDFLPGGKAQDKGDMPGFRAGH